MNQNMKVLMFPFCFIGHINPFIGFAQILRRAGHSVVFAIDAPFQGQILKFGFQEKIYHIISDEHNKSKDNVSSPNFFNDFSKELMNAILFPEEKTRLELMTILFKMMTQTCFQVNGSLDPQVEQIIAQVQPDFIIQDVNYSIPSIIREKEKSIPWINLIPQNPLFVLSSTIEDRLPLSGSGLATTDFAAISEFKQKFYKATNQAWHKMNNYFIANNLPSLPANMPTHVSPYLNIIMFPKELDYDEENGFSLNNRKFQRFDALVKHESSDKEFILPPKLSSKYGELIYFSLGTLASSNIALMNKFVSFFTDLPYRFIVSKGENAQQFELPDNCWGEEMIPQMQVLSMVDLAIIHGGNNSLTESFYCGTRILLMPLFFDQHDNAQRVKEKGYGKMIDPYKCSKKQFAEAIKEILGNEELKMKMKNASQRMMKELNENVKFNEILEEILSKQRNDK